MTADVDQSDTAPAKDRLEMTRRRSLLAIAGATGAMSMGENPVKAMPNHADMAVDMTLSVEAAALGISSKASPEANARALQRAVDTAAIVWLPASIDPINFRGPIKLKPGTMICGGGTEISKLASVGDVAFIVEAVAGWEVEGPCLRDFSLHCAGSGLVINDLAQSFSDRSNTQRTINRSRFERLRFTGSDKPGSTGLLLSKLFDTVIDQVEIRSFDTGLSMVGCDLCEMRGSSRIWLCDTLIELRRPEKNSTYGSGFTAIGCDLLAARKTFIRSDNNHLTLDSCYLEQGNVKALTGPALDIAADYMVFVQNCRFELPASLAPVFLRLRGEPLSFVFQNNMSRGDPWGRIDWNGDNSRRYWWNNMHRQHIVSQHNQMMPSISPLSRDVGLAPTFQTPWAFSPATPGLLPADYGLQCRIRDGAFVLPARPGFASQLRFGDPDSPLDGPITLHLQARGTHAGQRLKCAVSAGSKFVASETCVLETRDRWFTIHRNVNVADLGIALLNDDVGTGGEALISQIVVERGT